MITEVVGALIRDGGNRVFAHRRTAGRRLFPGCWDIPGGHVEAGETPVQALAREINEETGWRLRGIEATLARWEWTADGVRRRETDFLVTVDGDLTRPALEAGKHDASAWIGPENLDLMMTGRDPRDRALRDVVAHAVRTRLTERLRLEPLGMRNAGAFWRVHHDDNVALWYRGRPTVTQVLARVAREEQAWETSRAGNWIACDRAGGGLVGRGGVSYDVVDGERCLEVGWVLLSHALGRGYAAELGKAGLDYAFDGLGADRVVACTAPDNAASRAVMDRLGMRYLRDFSRHGAPSVLYEITRAGRP